MFARECFKHGIRGFEYKVGETSDIRVRKKIIALNKEGFENVKVSTLIAIQICAFEILNIHDPKRIFRIITRVRWRFRLIDSQTYLGFARYFIVSIVWN